MGSSQSAPPPDHLVSLGACSRDGMAIYYNTETHDFYHGTPIRTRMTKQWWDEHSDYIHKFLVRRLTDLGIEVPTTWPPSPMIYIETPTRNGDSWYYNTEDKQLYKHRKYSMSWTRMDAIEEEFPTNTAKVQAKFDELVRTGIIQNG